MRVGFSIMKEIHKKTPELAASDYGLKDEEFARMINLIERQGYIERVLRAGDQMSLKPARLTHKGLIFLQENGHLEMNYPRLREELKEWVRVDKLLYSNEAEDDE
ncbi:hypothetical protein D3P08_18840 [Paenibacillus nanensis]|uniref:Uncharacterized protein n=1 Tax=Paenibacillus nanensis TaxID=393251 RepID=A0A3A1UUA7_9BACL|nr:YjcQ family protein [Paenibacillus nanensis]RIX50762.1 hypothetical protein D3P08_18840 [Paenibacillus nanensis]